MSKDIVDRLAQHSGLGLSHPHLSSYSDIIIEAAGEIKRLRQLIGVFTCAHEEAERLTEEFIKERNSARQEQS